MKALRQTCFSTVRNLSQWGAMEEILKIPVYTEKGAGRRCGLDERESAA